MSMHLLGNVNDLLVASIAFAGSVSALAVGLGPWQGPYQLRTVATISQRYGTPAARAFWVLLAIISLLAGLAIISGLRPSYAKPSQSLEIAR